MVPCRPENTTIIRHRFKIEKIILFFDEFLEKFGHSFEDIEEASRMPSIVTAALDLVPSCLHATYVQAAYKLSND